MERVIAIDGPSGSGKSTLAKKLANSLNLLYIDTGAMYRALGLAAIENKLDLTTEGLRLIEWLNHVEFSYGKEDKLVIVDGKNLTDQIREHQVSLYASQISVMPHVRKFLVNFQRQLVKDQTCVMEGRDIGSVVFPQSFCKIFITASVDVRAKRRLDQLKSLGQKDLTLEQVRADVLKRDESDINRVESPLLQAEDAYLLDTSSMNEEDVLKALVTIVKEKALQFEVAL